MFDKVHEGKLCPVTSPSNGQWIYVKAVDTFAYDYRLELKYSNDIQQTGKYDHKMVDDEVSRSHNSFIRSYFPFFFFFAFFFYFCFLAFRSSQWG